MLAREPVIAGPAPERADDVLGIDLGEHAPDYVAPRLTVGHARVCTQEALPTRVTVLVVEEAPVSSAREQVVARREKGSLP